MNGVCYEIKAWRDFEQIMGYIVVVVNVLNAKYKMKYEGHKMCIVNVSKQIETDNIWGIVHHSWKLIMQTKWDLDLADCKL